jgi:hypothetical protein
MATVTNILRDDVPDFGTTRHYIVDEDVHELSISTVLGDDEVHLPDVDPSAAAQNWQR